jgi:hypothetical protein
VLRRAHPPTTKPFLIIIGEKIPIKIKRAFEREYGKKKGDLIFYKWENKHGMLKSHGKRKLINPRKVRLFGIGGRA